MTSSNFSNLQLALYLLDLLVPTDTNPKMRHLDILTPNTSIDLLAEIYNNRKQLQHQEFSRMSRYLANLVRKHSKEPFVVHVTHEDGKTQTIVYNNDKSIRLF